MEGFVVVGLLVAMLVVLGYQMVRLRESLYDRDRYLTERPVSDRRLKSMTILDVDEFWQDRQDDIGDELADRETR